MTSRRETARYHTVVHTLIRRAGRPDIKIYVLYLLSLDGVPPMAMQPLIEYVLEHGRTRSLAWQREVTRSVGLFVDYLKANEVRLSQTSDRPQVLAEFAEALVGGTIGKDGTDYSGLFWEPKSPSRVTVQLNAVTNFSDWLVQRYDTTPINPWRESTVAEKIAYWRRFDKRRASSMLAHTFNPENEAKAARFSRTVKVLRKSISHDITPAKHFPESSIWRLLSEGFQYRGKEKAFHVHERLNIRDMMITILLHAGGAS